MLRRSAGTVTKNGCAGEDPQQTTRPSQGDNYIVCDVRFEMFTPFFI
jgi:hypothetical protein